MTQQQPRQFTFPHKQFCIPAVEGPSTFRNSPTWTSQRWIFILNARGIRRNLPLVVCSVNKVDCAGRSRPVNKPVEFGLVKICCEWVRGVSGDSDEDKPERSRQNDGSLAVLEVSWWWPCCCLWRLFLLSCIIHAFYSAENCCFILFHKIHIHCLWDIWNIRPIKIDDDRLDSEV